MDDNGFQARTLLIVEDDPSVTFVLREQLTKLGIDMHFAEDGEQALEMLSKIHPDTILSDIRMPKKDGIELLLEIRKIGFEIPVILLTGFGSKDYMKSAIRLGAVDFLDKPWDEKELLGVIQRSLEMGRRMKENELLTGDEKKKNDRTLTLLRMMNEKLR